MQIFLKNPLAIQRNPRIEHRMWQNYPNISHVWNNFTEEGGGRGADLSNFGGEEPITLNTKKLHMNTILSLVKLFPTGVWFSGS